MRISYILGFLLALSLPAAAAEPDQNLKQEVAKLVSTYSENFNKKDAAGIASLYAGGGMLINTAGVHTDITKYYEGAFKAGVDHLEGAVHQVWPLSGDMSLATGESRLTAAFGAYDRAGARSTGKKRIGLSRCNACRRPRRCRNGSVSVSRPPRALRRGKSARIGMMLALQSATMARQCRFDPLLAVLSQTRQRAALVPPHQAGIAHYIGCNDCR